MKFATGNFLLPCIAIAFCSSLVLAQDVELERRIEQTIREAGVIESAATVDIASPVDGVIDWIIPDGSTVGQGELLLRLKSAPLAQELEGQKLLRAESERAVSLATQQLEEIRLTSTQQLELSKEAKRVDQLKMQSVLGPGGKLELRKLELEAQVKLLENRIAERDQLATRLRVEAENGLATEESLVNAKLGAEESRTQLPIVQAQLQWLETYERPLQLAVLELAVQTRSLEIASRQRNLTRDTLRAEATLAAAKAKLAADQAKQQSLENDITGSRIVSAMDGVVRHASGSRARATQPYGPGTAIRSQQPVLRLADPAKLQMKVQVNETQIHRVRVGQSVDLRVDAMADRVMKGKVTQVAKTPEPTSWFKANVKEYAVIVSIEKPFDGLRIGMTGLAVIAAGAR